MARFRPGPALDVRVAERFAVPKVRELADALAARIRANVPDAGVWMTAQDERVRPTHRDADGQEIPDNLRYILDHPNHEGQELARVPGDPDLSLENRINCRCLALRIEGLIAEHVATGDTVLAGPQARATVSVSFPRIVESENPGPEDGGGGWLARSVAEVAAGQTRSV
jgi:hypothetical protein